MGQKKRVSRHVVFSNGSPPGSEGSAGSPASNDIEACSNGSVSNLDGSFVTDGELVLVKGKTEIAKSGGGLEFTFTNEEVLSVRSECEKALVALRRGNSSKALKLIRDSCTKYENNALAQRVHGHICFRLASMIEDATTKQRHLKEAIEAAHKAVLLSPRSVEYAQFYAQLLFDVATDNRGYDEVIQECKRALEIEDPIDPAKDSLHEEGQHKLPTAESRIGQVQEELQNLLQKANIASISNWMKTLGNGGSEEKLRFIHMRKVVDDPMEQRVSQPKRPHEVKKSVKTPEEKRKDIEVRVAAARLLQQKRDCSPPQPDEGDLKPTRLERRRSSGSSNRKLSQAQSAEEKIESLKPFWNTLGPTDRERMLEVPLDSLKEQYSSSKMILTLELLIEALEFAQEQKTWRFWICCSCGERFIDGHEHAEHIMHKHINSLSPKLRRLLPHEIDQDAADQIVAQDCQPLDGPAAIKLLIDSSQLYAKGESIVDDHGPIVKAHGNNEVVKNGSITSTEANLDSSSDFFVKIVEDGAGEMAAAESHSSSRENGEEHNKADGKHCTCDSKCQKSKRVLQIGKDLNRLELPLADDEERKKILQKIFDLFGILIRNKCLASDHMEKIVQYAVDELQGFISDSSVQYELNPCPVYIRFLPASQLRRIFGYLRELVNACGLDQLSDNGPPSSLSQNEKEDVILDRLFLNRDFTAVTLDERLLKEVSGKPMDLIISSGSDISLKQHSSCQAEDPPSSSSATHKEGETFSHTDLQLSWIYQKADYEHQPAGWKQFKEARAQQGRDIVRRLEKEFLSLQTFCERKREHLHYEEAVIMAESLCIEELKKRELKGDGNFLGHEAVLRKHQQDILESQTMGLSSQQKLELDVIRSILREAQTINLPQFPYESAIAVTSTRLSDSEEEEEDSWKVPDFVPQLDPCIEVAIQRQKERATSEVNKLDARILRSMDSVQRLEVKLGNISVLDYRSIVLPLVKSFIKGQLEDAAEKDALQRSDAARDAFLAELLQDEKMTSGKLLDFGRSKEKPKDKKKNKEQRRFRDGKRVSGVAVHCPQKASGNGSAADSVGDSCDEDKDNVEEVVIDEAQVMEAELRRQTEVEEEERRLAETLELQRRVEEEAKERHLAELKKKQADKEALGLTQASVVRPNGTLLQDHGSLPQDNSIPPRVNEEGALAQSAEYALNIENMEPYGFLRSTSPKVYEATNDSVMTVPMETLKSGSHERPASGDGSSLPGESERPTNALEDLEIPDVSTLRAKKSGKSRRRRASRGVQDDNSTRCANGDGGIGSVSHFSEQMKRPLIKQTSNEDGSLSKVNGSMTHSSNKTLRELKAEQDAEERYQADLEQALQQSLANVAELPTEVVPSESTANEHVAVAKRKTSSFEELGKGLQNEIGQYNCFLNVVIQSLWHLRRFREEILAMPSSHHMHIGDPCVVCALRDIFVGLKSPSSDMTREAIAPTTLRIALSNLYSQKDFFQEAQMNDASEVLAVVFDCLHKAFTGNTVLSDGDSDASSGIGFWECQDHAPCIAHSLFALDIAMRMNCTNCGLESRHLKYTSFFHNINASSLRTAKVLYQESSLDELLRLVDMNQFLGCDVEVGGCSQQNYIHYLLRAAPHVFITVLGWQNSRESSEDISATMDAIKVDMDVGVVYRGLDRGFKHQLVSVICYYGQHYHCFAFNHDIGRWVMFDDTTVKIIGSYEDVVDTCRRGHLQPQVLFYEAVSGHGP